MVRLRPSLSPRRGLCSKVFQGIHEVDLTSSTPDSLTAPLKKILRGCLQKDAEGGDKLAEVQGQVHAWAQLDRGERPQAERSC